MIDQNIIVLFIVTTTILAVVITITIKTVNKERKRRGLK